MDILEKLIIDNPLIKFSSATDIQVKILKNIGDKINSTLNRAIRGNEVDCLLFEEIYGLFWLWVLGTYEVTRTMLPEKDKESFSPEVTKKLKEFKSYISIIRIPFAKQEYRKQSGEKPKPINGETSVSGIDIINKDLSYSFDGNAYSIRKTIAKFTCLMENIVISDVLKSHRDGY